MLRAERHVAGAGIVVGGLSAGACDTVDGATLLSQRSQRCCRRLVGRQAAVRWYDFSRTSACRARNSRQVKPLRPAEGGSLFRRRTSDTMLTTLRSSFRPIANAAATRERRSSSVKRSRPPILDHNILAHQGFALLTRQPLGSRRRVLGRRRVHTINLYAATPYARQPFPLPYLLVPQMSGNGRNRENRQSSPICPYLLTSPSQG